MEKEEERSLYDRLTTMEVKIDIILANCQECRKDVKEHGKDIVKLVASSSSAHKRIDGIYTMAACIGGVISIIFQVIGFAITHASR